MVKFAATCLVAAAISQVLGKGFSQTVLAQSGDTPNAFPIPDTLPEDTTLTVDGSTSMRLTNEAFESLFEQQFSNVDVRLEASRTDEAFQALIDGDVDILASGRPLTEAEQAQGVAELPLEREKLAVILGPNNPFEGDLTFEQFARIFRGEITSWAEVGGPDVPIRFVDRPDYSDTRRALSTYTVFEGQPFATGSTGDPVAEDETDAVVEALGADGIGYGVVSQVIDRDDVRIIPMHQTLPDDPRYPYSQYRAFAYREEASPAVLAFLGLATAAPGVGATGDTSLDPSAVVGSVSSDSSDENGAENTALPDTSAAGDLDAEDPDALSQTAPDTALPDTALSDGEDIASAGAAPASEADFPWWLLWLLAIPLLGGLLWWLLKGNRSAAPPPAPADAAGTDPAIAPTPAATPINAAGANPAMAPATAASPPAPADAAGTDPAIAPATAAVPAGIAAVGAAAAAAAPAARMVLTPRNAKSTYAQWEIPQEQLAAAKRQGGETMMVRLYDVTDREPSLPLPTPAAEFVCMESNSDLHLP
ncbi:MAG: substrate-binding domain-containing protein, partial [Cyanobacteria bacterium P01_D01_bin.2]